MMRMVKKEEENIEKALASVKANDAGIPNSLDDSKQESNFEKLIAELQKENSLKVKINK